MASRMMLLKCLIPLLLGISVHALAENGVAESKDKPAILHDNQAGTATKSKIIVEKGGEFLTQPSEEHVEYHSYDGASISPPEEVDHDENQAYSSSYYHQEAPSEYTEHSESSPQEYSESSSAYEGHEGSYPDPYSVPYESSSDQPDSYDSYKDQPSDYQESLPLYQDYKEEYREPNTIGSKMNENYAQDLNSYSSYGKTRESYPSASSSYSNKRPYVQQPSYHSYGHHQYKKKPYISSVKTTYTRVNPDLIDRLVPKELLHMIPMMKVPHPDSFSFIQGLLSQIFNPTKPVLTMKVPSHHGHHGFFDILQSFPTMKMTHHSGHHDSHHHQSVSIPKLKLPDLKLPDFKLPDFKLPDFKLPDFKLPDLKLPDIKLPEMKLPNVKLPDVKLHDFKLPEFHASHFLGGLSGLIPKLELTKKHTEHKPHHYQSHYEPHHHKAVYMPKPVYKVVKPKKIVTAYPLHGSLSGHVVVEDYPYGRPQYGPYDDGGDAEIGCDELDGAIHGHSHHGKYAHSH